MYFPKYIMLVFIPTQSISEKKEQSQKFKKKISVLYLITDLSSKICFGLGL